MVIVIMFIVFLEGIICWIWWKKRLVDDILMIWWMLFVWYDDILQGFVQENMKNLGNRNFKDWGLNKLKLINV